MLKGNKMDKLVLMLGGFHTTKVVFGCLGKVIKGCGAENVLIETGLFGVNKIIMNRFALWSISKRFFFFFDEALDCLQLQAFFTKQKVELYNQKLQILKDLASTLSDNSFEDQRILQIFNEFEERF